MGPHPKFIYGSSLLLPALYCPLIAMAYLGALAFETRLVAPGDSLRTFRKICDRLHHTHWRWQHRSRGSISPCRILCAPSLKNVATNIIFSPQQLLDLLSGSRCFAVIFPSNCSDSCLAGLDFLVRATSHISLSWPIFSAPTTCHFRPTESAISSWHRCTC
jgi:hypothetical protein